MRNFILYSFLLIFLFSACKDDENANPEDDQIEKEEELSNGEAFMAEVNLARKALAGGEEEWDKYVIEVIEPTLEILYPKGRYLDGIDPVTETNLYLELKNVYKDGRVFTNGHGWQGNIPKSQFPNVKPLIHDEKLSSGSEKWTTFFLNNEGTYGHNDRPDKYNVSEPDERGVFEVVMPEFRYYNTARAAVVAWLYDSGNKVRGHRKILLDPENTEGGGYVNTEVGGATARFR
ncbi:hypothetical protein C9994_07230 [Marivirga lumbricoides]|uniref:SCP domain-containing protein n=1 Tax=Marivirga lumbricoides TaxID=1046115 RepID=A0A2T4DRR8_9BACT|nr:hypothetical protein C9994_07230 [Marivirga lumbricoides]